MSQTTSPHRVPSPSAPPRRRVWVIVVTISIASFGGAIEVVLATLEQLNITSLGEAWWTVGAITAVVALPIVWLGSLALAALLSVVCVLVDGRVGLGPRTALSACALSCAAFATSVGAAAVMLGHSVLLATLLVASAHVLLALAYGWLLVRFAAVHRAVAIAITAVIAIATITIAMFGAINA